MRCYLVKAPGAERYAATNSDACMTRVELVELLDCKKKDVKIEQVEVPTGKADLLEFINELAKRLDGVEDLREQVHDLRTELDNIHSSN